MVCLNTDGALSNVIGRGSIDGLFRDHTGDCLFAYCKDIDTSTVLEVELWRILEGLQLARQNGFERIVIQTDSNNAFQLVTPPSPTSPLALVCTIADLYNRAWYVASQKIYREANVASDFIAKMTAPLDGSWKALDYFSSPLQCHLHRDILCSSETLMYRLRPPFH
ncbi:hypothetical protein F3Y22_tig00004630pilonHSYRG00043 [Hibiscus syriacus]|uniref:RNase H type-1 domain-containing protein n=1 Tax=Hibiscus syriacus TaxID=106335 RepID=A0A6A3CL05_HIBSY|nr:uncharacterized protein LOC120196141 [Hibiscus syriacus]KAE8728262.1 hypothetical protein F3Y22_tig00004630pilonHSYRG00043 [Hibiscus syriacus]